MNPAGLSRGGNAGLVEDRAAGGCRMTGSLLLPKKAIMLPEHALVADELARER